LSKAIVVFAGRRDLKSGAFAVAFHTEMHLVCSSRVQRFGIAINKSLHFFDSVTGIVTRLQTVRSVTRPAILRNVHGVSGAEPAVCLMGTGGSFPRSKADGAPSWPLSSIVQVKYSGAVFPPPLYAHFACAGTTLRYFFPAQHLLTQTRSSSGLLRIRELNSSFLKVVHLIMECDEDLKCKSNYGTFYHHIGEVLAIVLFVVKACRTAGLNDVIICFVNVCNVFCFTVVKKIHLNMIWTYQPQVSATMLNFRKSDVVICVVHTVAFWVVAHCNTLGGCQLFGDSAASDFGNVEP